MTLVILGLILGLTIFGLHSPLTWSGVVLLVIGFALATMATKYRAAQAEEQLSRLLGFIQSLQPQDEESAPDA